MQKLLKSGIGGIIDYAAEADLDEVETKQEVELREGVQCRVYSSTDELEMDKNRDIFLNCIRAVHNSTPEG